ncbi:hypothetical protein BUALT_Bualt04G0168300 [Buddleja alternifolia]|uniref:RING-type E3 ubiquitin transferase n=1 Tax=Buddleja alternifolia TaxID=168488 RepID=A0AAV6XTY9_9LAMI|nr:hypothetical protein BUALT_Bualt04G0168300 [Buddleja alternifolia]
MLDAEYSNKIPENPSKKQLETNENCPKNEHLFSPRFRSVAAMAGWDEEALLIASLVVEDTPDRQFKHKKRSDLPNFRTPPTNSRRKRRAQRRSPVSIPVTVLDLDEDEPKSKQESEKTNTEANTRAVVEKNRGDDEVKTKGSGVLSSSSPVIPCIDKLREELSCAICLEICYQPSTTSCGHSFCKKCLRSAADKCGKKCPKCRQLISNGRYCTINTVLWNTIQLLFPQEVEARKVAASASASASASDSHKPHQQSPARTRHQNTRNRSIQALNSPESESMVPARTRHQNTRNRVVEALNSPESENRGPERRNHRISSRSSRPSGMSSSMRRELPNQDEDAALALRLQREEFMEAFRVPDERRNSLAVVAARANLRAMASRAVNIRIRSRTD